MKFNFQKIVIVIAIILLILALAFIGTAISNEKNTHDFPPVIAECPDYWTHDVEQNKCINIKRSRMSIKKRYLKKRGKPSSTRFFLKWGLVKQRLQ